MIPKWLAINFLAGQPTPPNVPPAEIGPYDHGLWKPNGFP